MHSVSAPEHGPRKSPITSVFYIYALPADFTGGDRAINIKKTGPSLIFIANIYLIYSHGGAKYTKTIYESKL